MKKFVAILLLTTILILSLLACGTSEANTSKENENTNSETDGTTAVAIEYKPPQVNYNGAVINIGAMDHITRGVVITWDVMKYCEAYAPEQNGDPINDALYIRNQRVEEELNVKINVYAFMERASCGPELRKLIMASEDLVDIAFINGQHQPLFMGTDLVVNLNTIPNVDFSHSWWDQGSVKEFDIFGNLSSVTGDISLYIGFSPVLYLFNKKLKIFF